MNNLDLSTWPVWAVLFLVVINTFKEPVSSLLPTAVREFFAARRRRARQDVGELQLLGLVKDKDAWLQGSVDKKLDRLVAGSDRTNGLLADILAELRVR